jgi:hypothetical protein
MVRDDLRTALPAQPIRNDAGAPSIVEAQTELAPGSPEAFVIDIAAGSAGKALGESHDLIRHAAPPGTIVALTGLVAAAPRPRWRK